MVAVGEAVVGRFVGFDVGNFVGFFVVGLREGDVVGFFVVGFFVGALDGFTVGFEVEVGFLVGDCVGHLQSLAFAEAWPPFQYTVKIPPFSVIK